MVSYHNLHPCIALFDGVLDKSCTMLMLLVKIRVGETLALVDNTVKIGDTTLRKVGILQFYFRPQGAEYDVNVVNAHYLIIIGVYIRSDFEIETVLKGAEVEAFVKLMVAGHDSYLPIVFGGPVPEGMLGIILITKVADITGKHEYFASHLQRILFQKVSVLTKLQMEVGSVLNFHWFLVYVIGSLSK